MNAMKGSLLLMLFITFCLFTQAQSNLYGMPQTYLPKHITTSVDELAHIIEKHSSSSSDKTLLAYEWVTQNIVYSTDSLLSINWQLNFDQKVAATLRRRKGVCDNFASLYVSLLQKMNIPATVVYGMSSLSGNAGHSWAAFYEEGAWWLADPTWDAGNTRSFRYYKQRPSVFIQQHWPFDPLWQLLPIPISYTAFLGKERKRNTAIEFPNVADSALAYLLADSLQQLQAANKRIQWIGAHTQLSANWHAANKMNIAIIDESRNELLYNNAVAATNEASSLLNVFIEYRNAHFLPDKTQRSTRLMLENIPELLQKAKGDISLMGIGTPNYQYDPSLLLEKIKKIDQQLLAQLAFLDSYYKLPPEKRTDHFYR